MKRTLTSLAGICALLTNMLTMQVCLSQDASSQSASAANATAPNASTPSATSPKTPSPSSSASDASSPSTPPPSSSTSDAHDDKPSATADGKPSFWKWGDEQEWIIDSVGKDIAEMLVYAKYHNEPDAKLSASALKFQTTVLDKNANKYKFQLVLPGTTEPISYEFTLNGYVWSPATYTPLVKMLMDSLSLQADAASATPENYLKVLAGADTSELFAENERISNAISKDPLDPSLHEQAALLQATFAMLDLAGNFSDVRASLNRISAHLAIAEQFIGTDELNLSGKIADIALESMSCRDGVSVTKNDALAKSQTDETVKSILRGLKIRSSGDYRLFDEKKQTQLEASQFGLRYANFLSADKALDYISKHKCTPPLRWMRIADCSQGSVASGHAIDAQRIPNELGGFIADYKLYNKQPLKPQSLVEELNKTSTRCLTTDNGTPKLIVVSWGDIAQTHARQVTDAIYNTYCFYEYIYCVKEMGTETIKKATDLLGGMTMFPLALMAVEIDAEHKETNDKFFAGNEKLFVEHPELVPAYSWISAAVVAKEDPEHVRAVKTRPELWFSPPYPMGTAYYFSHRKSPQTANQT